MRLRATATLRTPRTEIEYVVTRSGEPFTLYVHGLAGSIGETRTFASGVPGTAAFMHLRGHGATRGLDGRWDGTVLAADVRAVSDQVGARQAVGVSLGALALLGLLAESPDRFTRVVALLPPRAVFDAAPDPWVRHAWSSIAGYLAEERVADAAEALLAMQPAAARTLPQARDHYAGAAKRLVGWGPALVDALRALPVAGAPIDPVALSAITTPVLVVGQHGDRLHPVDTAARLADALPNATYLDLGDAAVPWSGRQPLRSALAEFLTPASR
ncbi:MAG: alpha/beta fold hydrolase [Streptosporangiales bacterium]